MLVGILFSIIVAAAAAAAAATHRFYKVSLLRACVRRDSNSRESNESSQSFSVPFPMEAFPKPMLHVIEKTS